MNGTDKSRARTRTAQQWSGAKALTGWAQSRDYYTFQYISKADWTKWIGFGIEICTQQSFLKICKNSAWSFSFSKHFAVLLLYSLTLNITSHFRRSHLHYHITFQVNHQVYSCKTAFRYYISISQSTARRRASTK